MPLQRLLVLVALLANVALELPAMRKTEIHFVLKSQWLQEYCIGGDLTFDDVIPVGGVVDKLVTMFPLMIPQLSEVTSKIVTGSQEVELDGHTRHLTRSFSP